MQINVSLNNPEKGAISFAVFHHVLLEYLQAVGTLENEEEKEKMRRDVFEGYDIIDSRFTFFFMVS